MSNKKPKNLNIGYEIAKKIKNLQQLSEYPPDKMVADSERIAEELSSKEVKTSQIRKIHSYIVKIYTEYKNNKTSGQLPTNELQFLKPLLAYINVRNDRKMDSLQEVLSAAIDKIKTADDLEHFKKLYDSILAYHRYYGRER